MHEETFLMSSKELHRVRVMEQLDVGALTLSQAGERMGVSYRQARRIRQKWRDAGPSGLIHGSRGRVSNRCRPDGEREAVLARYGERYGDFGPTLAAEKLAEEGLDVPRETLRRWLTGAQLWPGPRRERKHRRRRPRRAHFGELVQLDGSDHAWFEDRGPSCTLMVMVDDATGHVEAHFSASESLVAAQRVLARWIGACGGIPAALYTDRASLYHCDREANDEEKRQGSGPLTKFGTIRWRLGMEHIVARSPQAKGRVERANGTLQDRLVKEMRLAVVSTMEAGNAFLDGFLADYNARFSRPAAREANLHRVVAPETDLEDLVAYETTRQVQNDWTVTYGSQVLQIARQPGLPAAKSRVMVRERPGGELALVWEGRELVWEPAARRRRVSARGLRGRRPSRTTTVLPAPAGAGCQSGANRPTTPQPTATGGSAQEGG